MLPIAIGGSVLAGGILYYTNNVPLKPRLSQITSALPPQKNESKPAKEQAARQATAPGAPEPVVEKADAVQEAAATNTTDAGNSSSRVVSIQVPSKMKNSSKESAPTPSHPEKGNRVSMMPGKAATTAAAVADDSVTKSAMQELTESNTARATESLIESHQTLWASMDEAFFKDLDDLNNSQLKARVVQLATEMKDRTKWEAVRLKEFMAMKEKDTADQYVAVDAVDFV